jgi:hypothetical protein
MVHKTIAFSFAVIALCLSSTVTLAVPIAGYDLLDHLWRRTNTYSRDMNELEARSAQLPQILAARQMPTGGKGDDKGGTQGGNNPKPRPKPIQQPRGPQGGTS